jgi:hypothetical protein
MTNTINISKATRVTRYVIANLYQLDASGNKLYASVHAKKKGRRFIVSELNAHAFFANGESVVGEYILGGSIKKVGRVEEFELIKLTE